MTSILFPEAVVKLDATVPLLPERILQLASNPNRDIRNCADWDFPLRIPQEWLESVKRTAGRAPQAPLNVPQAGQNEPSFASKREYVKFGPFWLCLDESVEKILNLKLIGLLEKIEAQNQSNTSNIMVLFGLLDELTLALDTHTSDSGFLRAISRFQGTTKTEWCRHVLLGDVILTVHINF